ncbi:MAG: BlaI/MecI/CopY family transcriptional regulator [Acidobacteria bacterium]|jgi:predicted transcriptional regulator|nr:BlaI/MecI/CopY family transcriptional regulator [Acidobacteriota bacterium]
MKIPKFLLRGFSRPSEAIIASLGALECDTMRQVWQLKEVSVRQVADAFQEQIAYTTVMTTLDRLYKKGLLERRKDGRAFLYAARFTPEELERGVAEDVIGSLLNTGENQIEPVLACIVDAVSERDLVLLDELERLVRAKRRELQNEDGK